MAATAYPVLGRLAALVRDLFGAGMVTLHDPGIAVDEAVYAVEQCGMRAVFIRPNPVNGRTVDRCNTITPIAAPSRMSGTPSIVRTLNFVRSASV